MRLVSAVAPFVLLAVALLLALLAVGCSAPRPHGQPPPAPSPAPPNPVTPTGPFAIELGAPGSDAAPLPLTDGQDVTLVAGAQGGFHVWLAYRVRNVPAGDLLLQREAHRVSDGTVVLRFRSDALLAAGADGWLEPAGPVPMFMCPPPIGVDVVGERIDYRLTLVDGDANVVGDAAIALVPRCPDGDAVCPRTCAANP